MLTTLEEARRCPKCRQPGELSRQIPAPRGATPGARMHIFVCKNNRCRWNGEVCRVVQVNPDGSIPEPTKHVKSFPEVPDRTAAVNAMTAEQLAIEMTGGGEVTR